MNFIHGLFFVGTVVVSLGFALYGQWILWKYALPGHKTAVTGCEMARYVLDQRGSFHIGVTPLESSEEYSSSAGLFLEPKIYEGRDFLSILQAARQAFLKSQLSNMTFWVRLKTRMAFVVRVTVLIGWCLFLLGIFFQPLRFLINMGLGCFTVVMILAIFDLPFEMEVEEATSGFLGRFEHFERNEFMHLKKLNQAIAFWGLASIVRAPSNTCLCFFKKSGMPYAV